MSLSRRTYLKVSSLAGAWLLFGASWSAAAQRGRFLIRFAGVQARAVGRIVFGKPFTSESPRSPVGVEETDLAFRRESAFGALTNVEFLTDPFVVPNDPLRLNIDVLHGAAALNCAAYAMVEVLDENGKVIPGFEREDSLIGDVNLLDYKISWGSKTSTELAGRKVSLLFLLRDARLYALHTKKHEPARLAKVALTVETTDLEPWQTSNFSLRGEGARGELVPLDHQQVSLIISDPDMLVARSDKRDLHRGRITAYRETDRQKTVTVRADVIIGNKEFQSNSVPMKVSPLARKPKSPSFKMLFIQPDDVESGDRIRFEPNTLEYYADTRGLPTTPKAMTVFNRKIGDEYHVWGSSRGAGHIFRGMTTDGINYTTEPVRTEMDPQNFLDMTWSPARNEYLAFERSFDPTSRFFAHISEDGSTFGKGVPAYFDFDGVELAWDAANNQYVAHQLSFQPLDKPRRYPDNLKNVVALYNNSARRVFTRRTSPDGINWSGGDMYQRDPATWAKPESYIIVPDAADPPDLECYWLNVFPYGDRYLGIVMFYAVAPPNFLSAFPYDQAATAAHGPHVTTEWIVSSDLKRWERPFRNFKATEDWRIYFSHAPMMLHDRLLFLAGNQIYNLSPHRAAREGQNNEIYSLPADRIVSASGERGASFTTKPFTMPGDPLHINASGRLSVEVLDQRGEVIRGFEHQRSVEGQFDKLHLKLMWAGADTTSLHGQTVRLRFRLHGARVYSIHTY